MGAVVLHCPLPAQLAVPFLQSWRNWTWLALASGVPALPKYFRYFSRLIILSTYNRARTGNLRLAKPALSQLSYVPLGVVSWVVRNVRDCSIQVVSKIGCRTGGRHGVETPCLPGRLQWAHVDSNHGPQLYQSCALTN